MNRKESNKIKILEYLSDPGNDFMSRADIAITLLGYKNARTLYRFFTTAELSEMESAAIVERKARSSRQRAHIYTALYKRAIGYSHPDVHISNYQGEITITDIIKHYPPETQAAREYLDRIEGKVPEAKGNDPKENGIIWEDIGRIFAEAAAKIATKVPDDYVTP